MSVYTVKDMKKERWFETQQVLYLTIDPKSEFIILFLQ